MGEYFPCKEREVEGKWRSIRERKRERVAGDVLVGGCVVVFM